MHNNKPTPLPVYNRLLSEPERNVPSSPHHQFKPGSKVRRNHIYDGSPRAGTPVGPALTVVELITPPNIGVGCVEVGALCVLSDGEKVYGWNLSDAPIAIHAEVSEYCVITDFSDGSFTQEFFEPSKALKGTSPKCVVIDEIQHYAPQPYPQGRYSGTCHCGH